MSITCRQFRIAMLSTWLGLSVVFHSSALAVSLQDLLNGNSLVVGNARFSDWHLTLADATSGSLPDLSLVTVTPLVGDIANPGFQVTGNGELAISATNALDLVLQFQVSPLPGGKAFVGHTLALTGVTFGGASGTTLISQEPVSPSLLDLGPALVMADSQASALILNDDATFAPTSNLTVTLNLFEQGLDIFDSINISTFTSRFAQTGPVVLAGDYNDDGTVDMADYVVWRNRLGAAPGSLDNDVDGGPIGAAHHARWKANYGLSWPAASAFATSPVPEPTAWGAILLFAGTAMFVRRRANSLR